ncbi:hypothetical protein ABZP36_024521 [Zizania latifolia]
MRTVEPIFSLPKSEPLSDDVRSSGDDSEQPPMLAVRNVATVERRPKKAKQVFFCVARPLCDAKPIDVVPLAARPSASSSEIREPPWMRNLLVSLLNLCLDLPVHFIDEKVMTQTDLDPQKNRFHLRSTA